ncbi:MAG: histone deacetylase family protein [Sedimenticola sp.]
MEVILSKDHLAHFPSGEIFDGRLVRPFECPERWHHIVSALNREGFSHQSSPNQPDSEKICAVHDKKYIDFLKTCWDKWTSAGYTGDAIPTISPVRGLRRDRIPDHINGKLGYYALASETSITAGTWQAAQAAAAIAQAGQQRISSGASSAFALCRPPGHHASANQFGGYCFLNNAAIAAQGMLIDGADRVAILDIDFHHGNGTQSIFYNRSDVLFVSLHGNPKGAFPYFLGYADETGEGLGEGTNLNLPMGKGTMFDVWAKSLAVGLKAITEYQPDALVVSLGVDTFKDDPISFFCLTSDNYLTIGQLIADLGLPTLYVMEGGYAVEEIGINTVNVLLGHANK